MKLDITQLYFITGFFWQEVIRLDIRLAPIEGAVSINQTGVVPFFFAGTIWKEDEQFRGKARDEQGPSSLYRIKLEGNVLSFTKLYEKDKEETRRSLSFVLKDQGDGSWEGKYSSMSGPEGPAFCFLQSTTRYILRDKGQRFYDKWKKQGRQ